MAETNSYQKNLSEALAARANWIEGTELGKLKADLRIYQSSFAMLYNIYLKKGLINEDPYKQDVRIAELEVPDSGAFAEGDRVEKMSIRLSNYDNQLDFLVNFYQFSVESLKLDQIKRILGLVKYIDWVHLTADSPSPNTQAVADLTAQSKNGIDPLALNVIGKSLGGLSQSTGSIMQRLKVLSDYQREAYKLEVRTAVSGNMSEAEAAPANIKKKFPAALPGRPFYAELIEEIIREDYSKDGPALQEKILKGLQVPEGKSKTVKPAVSIKSTLIMALQVLGSVSNTLLEIGSKLDENETLFANRKQSFGEKVRRLFQQMMNKEPESAVFDLDYIYPVKGRMQEKVTYNSLRSDMEKKARTLGSFTSKAAAPKLEAMADEQLTQLLDRSLRDIQPMHRTLTGLDEYFKDNASTEDRSKIKGIKPELATMKNAITRSNQLRHEYSAQKEEEEQMKKLGISTGA
ncbi:hypothetical protein FACS189442_1760 [Spirochaetia bacterium]|nr:hypothetical protein FACS189442_1760 [Spirochaetia bacterium]